MRSLICATAPEDLADVYEFPAPRPGGSGAWVRATFVATVDGSAQGPEHRSGELSGAADRTVFALQRSLCDVILVGAGTARVERYRRVQPHEVRADLRAGLGLAPVPTIAVVSRSLDLDPGLLEPSGGPVMVLTTAAAPADRVAALGPDVDVVVHEGRELDLSAAIDALVTRGFTRVHCEGGPTLLASMVAAGLLDDLCLTTSPLLVAGDGARILHGPWLSGPLQLSLAALLEDDGALFARYLVER